MTGSKSDIAVVVVQGCFQKPLVYEPLSEGIREHGYHTVRTQTYNRWRQMLMLNLRFGFDIVGTMQGKRGLIIVMEKNLA